MWLYAVEYGPRRDAQGCLTTVALPWELLYARDLVVIAETEHDLIKRLNEWKDFV